MMTEIFEEFNVAITVCDKEGKVIWMNSKSQAVNKGNFAGKSLLDCHPEPAKTKLLELLNNHSTNAYTIQKGDVKKLIYQAPWHSSGEFAGYVELSIEIPVDMPHYIRKTT